MVQMGATWRTDRPVPPLRLALIYFLVLTRPSPLWGLLDYYIGTIAPEMPCLLRTAARSRSPAAPGFPIDRLSSRGFKVADFTLREKLGGGNYGVGTRGSGCGARGAQPRGTNDTSAAQPAGDI